MSRSECAARFLALARAGAGSSDASCVANDVLAREEIVIGRARERPRLARVAGALALDFVRAEVSD